MTDVSVSPWTAERVAKLKEGIAQGRCARDIADALGVTRSAVCGKAARLHQSIREGSRTIAHLRVHWTAEQDAQLRSVVALGLSANEVAQRMGKSREAIYRRAAVLALRFDRHKRKFTPVVRKPHVSHPAEPKQSRYQNYSRNFCAVVDNRPPKEYTANIFARFAEGYDGQVGRLTLFDLDFGVCRFPIDQKKGPVKFCGLPGHPYCPEHQSRCSATSSQTIKGAYNGTSPQS